MAKSKLSDAATRIPTSLRVKPLTDELWDGIAERLGISKSAVFEMLIHERAAKMEILKLHGENDLLETINQSSKRFIHPNEDTKDDQKTILVSSDDVLRIAEIFQKLASSLTEATDQDNITGTDLIVEFPTIRIAIQAKTRSELETAKKGGNRAKK